MTRCFLISICAHLGLILGLVVLSLLAPLNKPLKRDLRVTLLGAKAGGLPGLPGGGPSKEPEIASISKPEPPSPPAPSPQAPAPKAIKPRATPKPAIVATPVPKPQPRHTPTPASKPTQTVKKKSAVPKLSAPPIEQTKKIIHRPKDKSKQLVETEPTPTPQPTPQEVQVVESKEFNSKEPLTSNDVVTANDTAAPEAPTVPSVDASALPAPSVDTAALGQSAAVSSGKGLASKSGALQMKGGDGIVGGGGGGGGGGLGDINQTYFVIALSKIEPFFKPPISRAGMECRVRFYIQRDGTISNIQIDKSTGISTYDQSAVQALEQAKLPPLYDGIKESYLDVVVTFNYERKQ